VISEEEAMMNDDCKVANPMTMDEKVTKADMRGLHTDVNKKAIIAQKELVANVTFNRQETHEIACKRDDDKKQPGNNTSGVEDLHTREDEENRVVVKELPADNRMLATYVNERTMLPLKELSANDGMMTKHEDSHSRNMMKHQMMTLSITNDTPQIYTISSQKGDEDRPTADLRREEDYFEKEYPHNIDEPYQEDVANYEQTDGVATKMFEVDSGDACGGQFSPVSMGARAEGLACTDPGVRTPIDVSGDLLHFWPRLALLEFKCTRYMYFRIV
jgi:hypothetical protein